MGTSGGLTKSTLVKKEWQGCEQGRFRTWEEELCEQRLEALDGCLHEGTQGAQYQGLLPSGWQDCRGQGFVRQDQGPSQQVMRFLFVAASTAEHTCHRGYRAFACPDRGSCVCLLNFRALVS